MPESSLWWAPLLGIPFFGANPAFTAEDYTFTLREMCLVTPDHHGICYVNCAILAGYSLPILNVKIFTWPYGQSSSRRTLINLGIPLDCRWLLYTQTDWSGRYRHDRSGMFDFYGLGLVNASKYTYGDIRYLGYIEIVLGLGNLWPWVKDYTFGLWFRIAHILYGVFMWNRYR